MITIGPGDTLLMAFQRMRMADISQVPVIENGAVVGILDESDVLMSIHTDPQCFTQTVRTAMTQNVETLAPGASIERHSAFWKKGL